MEDVAVPDPVDPPNRLVPDLTFSKTSSCMERRLSPQAFPTGLTELRLTTKLSTLRPKLKHVLSSPFLFSPFVP